MAENEQTNRSWLSRLFIARDENRLRAGWRLLAHFAIFFGLLLVVSIPVGVADYLLGLSDDFAILVRQVAIVIALTASVLLARRFVDRRPFAALGLRRPQAALDYGAGFVVAGVIMGAIYLAELGLGWLSFEGFAWRQQPAAEVLGGLVVWAAIFVIGAWLEELLCRGYWLQNLAEGVNLPFGVIASSVMFGLLHADNPKVSALALGLLMVAGVFLAYGYLQTRQLWLGMGLHLGWNYFEGNIFGFQVSGLDTFRLIHQSVKGPEWLTGGQFGPEAGFIVLPAMLLGAALIFGYVRFVRPKPA